MPKRIDIGDLIAGKPQKITPESFIKLRKRAGLSQQACAKLLRRSLSGIQKIEGGSREIDPLTFEIFYLLIECPEARALIHALRAIPHRRTK